MKRNLLHILKGRFLIDDDSAKNWRFILFATLLFIVMIGSSHRTEKKIQQINVLDKKVKELRSEYVDLRSILMKLKMESLVVKKVKNSGLVSSNEPPKKIRIIQK